MSGTAASMLPASGLQVSAFSCWQGLHWACRPRSMDLQGSAATLQVLVGGALGKHASGGQFYQPTVLVGVTSGMRIWRWALLSMPDAQPASLSGCL